LFIKIKNTTNVEEDYEKFTKIINKLLKKVKVCMYVRFLNSRLKSSREYKKFSVGNERRVRKMIYISNL
jgi:hypothetical protein